MLNSQRLFFYCADEKGSPGAVRLCRYPLAGAKEIYELQSHAGTISKLSVCYDDNYVFSTGEDGSFVVYEVRDKDCKVKTEILDPSEEFLYAKSKLRTQKALLDELRNKNTEAKEKREKFALQSRLENDRTVAEWNRRIKERSEEAKKVMDKETDEIIKMEQEQARRLAALELEHRSKRESVERDYAEKILL